MREQKRLIREYLSSEDSAKKERSGRDLSGSNLFLRTIEPQLFLSANIVKPTAFKDERIQARKVEF